MIGKESHERVSCKQNGFTPGSSESALFKATVEMFRGHKSSGQRASLAQFHWTLSKEQGPHFWSDVLTPPLVGNSKLKLCDQSYVLPGELTHLVPPTQVGWCTSASSTQTNFWHILSKSRCLRIMINRRCDDATRGSFRAASCCGRSLQCMEGDGVVSNGPKASFVVIDYSGTTFSSENLAIG